MIEQNGPEQHPPSPQPGELDWEFGTTAKLPSRGIDGPDDLLAGSSPERKMNVEVVMSAFRSLLSSIAYVSMPITSGKRLYDVLDQHGVKSREELDAIDPEILHREVIDPNVQEGNQFSQAVTQRSGYPVLVPGIFESKGQRWEEREYMALWLTVLEGKAKEIHLITNWEYSNGGVEEFVRGTEMRAGLSQIEDNSDVKVLDNQANPISLNAGAKMIFDALVDLRGRGFEAPRLEIALRKLEAIGKLYAGSQSPPQAADSDFDLVKLTAYNEAVQGGN